MNARTASAMVVSAALVASVWGATAMGRRAPGQEGSAAAAGKSLLRDEYQRSLEIFEMKTSARSGAQRGEDIYYYKCWYCHNQYAKTGPQLKDLYKRAALTTGEPVNDATVAAKIRNGSPAMPAYRYTLTDAHMADLLAYIREGTCCFDAEEPPPNPHYRGVPAHASAATSGKPVLRGARGTVRNAKGEPIEGIGVQLIASRTAIRTTVFTNEDGRYQFPVLEAGQYTLRIARPLEYTPYVKEPVAIDGATQLQDIVLARVSDTEFLPPMPETLAQLVGAEWMMNLPGNGEEKRVFSLTCGFGCHSYQQIFRTRYDLDGWRMIVRRMLRGGGSPLINVGTPTPESRGRGGRQLHDEELVARWLAKVRGPDAQDEPLHYWPRLRGASTRVIVTEYELPRQLLAPHDVHGDSRGNIWYTAHRSPYSGVLDPRTGIVTEIRIPEKEKDTVGALPGTHRVWVDKHDIAWFSEQWDHHLTAVDTRTNQIVKRFHFPTAARINSSGMSNFGLDDNGYAYETFENSVVKIDTKTGEIVKKFPLTARITNAYESLITPDGRYWSGGAGGSNIIGLLDTTTGQLWELEAPTPVVSAARGGFDRDGNAWWGGRGGMLLKVDVKTRRITEYYPPLPYVTFYECLPDKNGEIWAAPMHSGRFLRFNPRTEHWTEYPLPEPYSHDRRTWIDNSTDPVTVWYVDQNGYVVRIQPLQ